MNVNNQNLDMEQFEVQDTNIEIPVWRKTCLSVSEISALTGIGKNKVRELCNQEGSDKYVLRVGRRLLIKRVPFEVFLLDQASI